MKYLSTRNSYDIYGYSFRYVIFTGLSENAGLFVPEFIPKIEIKKDMNFFDIAFLVFRNFIDCNEIDNNDLYNILQKSFLNYKSPLITPLVKLEKSKFNILELYWGPTYSFKDIALGVIGNLFEYFLEKNELSGYNLREKINILCATSGDTGSAAINSLKGKKRIRCCVLHPNEKISNIQKLQMTTVNDPNIINLAVNGTFDDCQKIVKRLLFNFDFVSVNSINWARILTQIVYYIWGYVQYLNEYNLEWGVKINYSVPTGNFGNILAGYYAKKIGLPIDKLIISTNQNDTLYRFLQTGKYEIKKVQPSQSPAMDISTPSNFERLLYHATLEYNNSRESTCSIINFQFRQTNFIVEPRILDIIKKDFVAKTSTDDETKYMINYIYNKNKYIIDPHTAVGICGYYKWLQTKYYQNEDLNNIDYLDEFDIKNNVICLSTAHPGKFNETVSKCIDLFDFIPDDLKQLEKLPQKYHIIENHIENVLKYL